MLRLSWFDKNIHLINKVLLFLIIAINVYVIVTPFMPQITYRVDNLVSNDAPSIDTSEQRQTIDRSYDHLIIPGIKLDEKIWVGDNEKLVNKGIWHIPHSSTPDKGSNTVLVGHRFSYKDAAVLYHLDKIKQDDPIAVAWDGKVYTYKVSETKIVKPTDVYIESPTEDNRLTIYTCHPVWSIRERLVVIANLESVE